MREGGPQSIALTVPQERCPRIKGNPHVRSRKVTGVTRPCSVSLNSDFPAPPTGAYPRVVVDTAVRPPASPPTASTTTRRPRRRWLWWLLAALLVIVVAATSIGIVVVSNYQPFVPGYKQYYG